MCKGVRNNLAGLRGIDTRGINVLVLCTDGSHRSTVVVVQGQGAAADVADHGEVVLLVVDGGIGGRGVDLQAITKLGGRDLVVELDVRQV